MGFETDLRIFIWLIQVTLKIKQSMLSEVYRVKYTLLIDVKKAYQLVSF